MEKKEYSQKVKAFVRKDNLRGEIVKAFAQNDCEAISVYPYTERQDQYSHTWGIYFRPGMLIRNLLSVKGVFLVLVIETTELLEKQDRVLKDIGAALQVSMDDDYPLSDDFIVLVCNDPHIKSFARDVEDQVGIPVIFFSTIDVRDASLFNASITSRLYVRDLYTLKVPIIRSSQFYGRQPILKELFDYLVNAKTHVGLFGQRKMGKTSCLYRLAEMMTRRPRVVFCHIDLEIIDSISKTTEYFLWSIGEAINASLGRKRTPEFMLFGKYPVFSFVPDFKSIPDLFLHDIKVLIEKHPLQLFIIALDEIELMSPKRKGPNWGSESGRAWRFLRGISQQFPQKIIYLVTGSNPQITEMPRFPDEHENPIYTFFKQLYLRPFNLEETSELLIDVGHQLGLGWGKEAITRIYSLTGGHPLLVRLCGSVIHKALLPRSENTIVSIEQVQSNIGNILAATDENLGQMIDILEADYQDELTLLEILAKGQENEFREYALHNPKDVAHLHDYGLITHSETRSRIKIELLQSWLQKRRNRIEIIVGESERHFKTGQFIGQYYKVISTIGHPGGMGEVYLCNDERNQQEVALKVIVNGDYSTLLRETDILEKLEHPNIVKILGKGLEKKAAQTSVEQHSEKLAYKMLPFLVMEYLNGKSLRQFCSVAERLNPEETHKITIQLLEVLKFIHPNPQKVEHITKQIARSQSDNEVLELSRHGYIHRDIKPENIILVAERGPVLIDFNISVRCGSPVQTISSTRGYIPPDGLSAVWDPDIDLYQLGLTILQVSTGIEFDGANFSDIDSKATADLPKNLSGFLLRLCAPHKRQRFQNAEQALGQLRKLSLS